MILAWVGMYDGVCVEVLGSSSSSYLTIQALRARGGLDVEISQSKH